jgi:S1-C subfamily serine protease
MADKTAPVMRSQDLRETLNDITGLLMEMRRQQLELEAYGQVTRLALGALLRAVPPEARAQVAARLSEPAEALLGPDVPPGSPLGRAVLEEAARMAAALTDRGA